MLTLARSMTLGRLKVRATVAVTMLVSVTSVWPALAQSVPSLPATGPGGTISRTDLQNTLGGKRDHIKTISDLRAWSPAAFGNSVEVGGYYSDGDGGGGLFVWNNISLATDDGCGTIKPSSQNAGRWLRVIQKGEIAPEQCGAKGDGATNDAPAFVTALAFLAAHQGTALRLGAGPYVLNAGIVIPQNISMVGPNSTAYLTTSIIQAGAPNLTLITLSTGARMSHLSIDMSRSGSSGTGTALFTTAYDIIVDDVRTYKGCIGADMAGAGFTIDRSDFEDFACGGIRVGHTTTNGVTTDPRIMNTAIISHINPAAQYGVKVEDAGGLYMTNNDILYPTIGTWFAPGTNQWIAWPFFDNTVIADSSGYYGSASGTGFLIDTAASTGKITGGQFTSSWVGTNVNGVVVQNTGGGTISGLHFLGLRALGSGWTSGAAVVGNNISINAGTDITVDSSHICGNIGSGMLIFVGTGVSGGAIRNNRGGATCDAQTGMPAAGVTFNGSNSNWIVTGNDFSEVSSLAFNNSPTGVSVVRANAPTDTALQTIAASGTLSTAHPYSMYVVTGSATVTSIASPWNGRQILFYPSGTLTFSLGGNLCNALTAALPVTATYVGTCWLLK